MVVAPGGHAHLAGVGGGRLGGGGGGGERWRGEGVDMLHEHLSRPHFEMSPKRFRMVINITALFSASKQTHRALDMCSSEGL